MKQPPWVMVLGAAAAAVVLCGIGEAEAQGAGRRASLFDIGIYGGGAYTTDWYSTRSVSSSNAVITERDDEEGRRIGFAPTFGAKATFFGLPWAGVRVHYGYMPSDLPEGGGTGTSGGVGGSDYFVNNHFYDLSLVFRAPGIPVFSSVVSNGYLWLGGGGLTTDVAGESGGCVPELLAEGACLSFLPDRASVGQGVVGIGGDIVSLAANMGLFVELAAHFYDSPVHTTDGFVPRITVQPGEAFRVADDKYAVTPRLVAGLKLAFGGQEPTVVPVAVAAPAPRPAPPPPAPAAAPAMREVRICVVQGTALTEVTAMVNPATGDTMVDNRRFAEAYPATSPAYAASSRWFINDAPVRLGNLEYVKFGVPRVIAPAQLTHVGVSEGVGLYAETGATAPYSVLYVPIRPGCEFQPFQQRSQIRVRG